MDENFYIYLCFGQSNMEGNAQWESPVDENVDERFQMLATCDFENPHRTVGEWYWDLLTISDVLWWLLCLPV